jgi:asparagine synthase (glutamine-hydrolysing)
MYYAFANGAFYFTSSLTCFSKLPFEINPDAVSDFLHFLYVPAPGTIYKQVKAVLPGHVISFHDNKIDQFALSPEADREKVYTHTAATEDEYLYGYETYLKKSILNACSNDQRAALFLSGGKDSSVLAIGIKEAGLRNVEAISMSYGDESIDECKDARVVAEHLGIPFRPIKFSPSTYFKHWKDFIKAIGQPFGDPATLPVYVTMKELNDHFDVYLDGTGNDRYMGITTTWQEDYAWYLYRLFPGLRYIPWKYLDFKSSYSLDVFLKAFSRQREEQFVSWKGWSAEEISKLMGIQPDWRDIPLYQKYRSVSSSMNYKTATLCEIWEPEAAYRKTVQSASTLGKAIHFPFLDKELMTFSAELPSSLKHRDRTNKIILRMLQKKYLPSEILVKRKGVFNFPKEYILGAENNDFVYQLLSRDNLVKHGLIEPSFANKYVEDYINGNKNLEDRIWSLALLHSWLEEGRNEINKSLPF